MSLGSRQVQRPKMGALTGAYRGSLQYALRAMPNAPPKVKTASGAPGMISRKALSPLGSMGSTYILYHWVRAKWRCIAMAVLGGAAIIFQAS